MGDEVAGSGLKGFLCCVGNEGAVASSRDLGSRDTAWNADAESTTMFHRQEKTVGSAALVRLCSRTPALSETLPLPLPISGCGSLRTAASSHAPPGCASTCQEYPLSRAPGSASGDMDDHYTTLPAVAYPSSPPPSPSDSLLSPPAVEGQESCVHRRAVSVQQPPDATLPHTPPIPSPIGHRASEVGGTVRFVSSTVLAIRELCGMWTMVKSQPHQTIVDGPCSRPSLLAFPQNFSQARSKWQGPTARLVILYFPRPLFIAQVRLSDSFPSTC